MLFGFFYGDWTMIIVLPALFFSIWAEFSVKSAYRRYSAVRNRAGLTGADAAERVLSGSGVYNVRLEPIAGQLTDHYDPNASVIRLSEGVYRADSVAAVGIACHEAGHALQYSQHYFPVRVRTAILPVCRFGSAAAMPIFFLGLLLANSLFLTVGIYAYATVALFQLLTLPVEFNASRRAVAALSASGYFTEEDLRGVRCVLRAAALTYVAALATSLLTLLRLILLASGGRRRN